MPKRRDDGAVLPTSRLAPFLLPLLFTILVVAIGGVTWRFYVTQKEVFDRVLGEQLPTTADAKVRQLAEWRRARLGQAHLIASGAFVVPAMLRAITGEATESERDAVQEKLRAI